MKKKWMKLASVAATLLATATIAANALSAPGGNLIMNPGFEDGMQGWANRFPKEVSHETALTRNGKGAFQIDTTVEKKQAYLVQVVGGIRGGAEYEFTAWARRAPDAGVAGPKLKLETYNSVGENTAGWSEGVLLPEDGSWQQITLRKRVFGDTTLCKLYIRTFTSSIIFDDVSFKMVSPPPPVIIMTPSKSAVEEGAKRKMTYQLALGEPWKSNKNPQITAHIAPQFKDSGFSKNYDLRANVRKIDDSHYNAEINTPTLEATDYIVSFSMQRDGKTETTPYPAYLFTVPKNRKPNYLSDTGTILRDGKPFFPIGMYHPSAGSIARNDGAGAYETGFKILSEMGFNAVQGGFGNFPIANKYGLAVDVALYQGGKVKANLDKNLKRIKETAADPAVLNWKIVDEPQWKSIDGGVAAEVSAAYRAIKAADPHNPIELTNPAGFDFWGNFCDIIQVDVYPVPRFPLSQVSGAMEEARKTKFPWQNLQAVLSCGWGGNSQPTAPEARSMVYQALIHGAKGIWWYSMHEGGPPEWRLQDTPLWPHLKDINAEVNELSMPMMLGKDVPVQTSNSLIQVGAKEYQGKLYVLFTNPTEKETHALFTFKGLPNLLEGKLLHAEGRTFIQNQNISLSMGPLQSDTIIFDLTQK